jgi:hypothetical protein
MIRYLPQQQQQPEIYDVYIKIISIVLINHRKNKKKKIYSLKLKESEKN